MTRVLQADDRPWLPMDGEGENYMKIVNVDEVNKQVTMIVKFAPNAIYPSHLHRAGAVAYTLEGEWEYEEGTLPVGSWAFEPPGTEHLPVVSEKGATILAVLTSADDRFVEVPLPDGGVLVQDLAYFKRLYNMTPEQAAAEHAIGVTMTSKDSQAA